MPKCVNQKICVRTFGAMNIKLDVSAVKQKLRSAGQNLGFDYKDEFRVNLEGTGKPVAYIHHVWLRTVSLFARESELPIIGFKMIRMTIKLEANV